MSKVSKKLWAIVLLSAMLLSLFGATAAWAVRGSYSVDEKTPFYDNPWQANGGDKTSNVAIGADGNYVIAQKFGGGSGAWGNRRLLYGYNKLGSGDMPYYVDLSDFSMSVSIDALEAGKSIRVGFVEFKQNGLFPDQGANGLGFNFADDGNMGMNPTIYAYGEKSSANVGTASDPYLVYNNASPRTDYRGKTLTLSFKKSGDKIDVVAAFDRDSVNAETAVDYRASFATSSLSFDYKQCQMVITNDNAAADMEMTIRSISDPITNAYFASVGGRLGNRVKYLAEYDGAIAGFNVSAPTASAVKTFFTAKPNFETVDSSKLRNNDKIVYDELAAKDIKAIETASLGAAAKVFEGYTTESVITDINDAVAVLMYYNYFEKDLSADYAATVAHMANQLADEDLGQLEVAEMISALIAEYPTVSRESYLAAQKGYTEALAAYNALTSFVKKLVSNYDLLQEFGTGALAAGKAEYYTTKDTYFSNFWINGNGSASAIREESGKTLIALPDNSLSRIAYGTDESTPGNWKDYQVSIKDFAFDFTLDSISDQGRFGFNFAEDRSVLAYGGETKLGLTVTLRMSGSGSADVVLCKTAGRVFPTKEQVPGIGTFGEIGSISHTGGLSGKKISLSWKETAGGVMLTVSVEGGNLASKLIPTAFLNSVFTVADKTVDMANLSFTITAGEDAVFYNKGSDIRLSLFNINDGYAKASAEHTALTVSFYGKVSALAQMTSLTDEEIVSYNADLKEILDGAKDLRKYEKELHDEYWTTFVQAELNKVDPLVAANVRLKLDSLAAATVDNYETVKTEFDKIDAFYLGLTDTQKALVTGYAADAEAIRKSVADCKAAKGIIDRISEIVERNLVPTTIDEIREDYAAIANDYENLTADQKALVTNKDVFDTFGEKLDAYDPAGSVKDAIDKLYNDYGTLSAANRAKAKKAAQEVTDSYAQLTDGQKEEVTNYAKLGEFYTMIADFEAYLTDLSIAGEFDLDVANKAKDFAEINTGNLAQAEALLALFKENYGKLTADQKQLVTNYGTVESLENAIAAYKADESKKAADKAAADTVNALIGAIGTVEKTEVCKAKIDAARSAYNALTADQKALVNNEAVLAKAEADYAALNVKPESSGCNSGSSAALLGVIGLLSVAVMKFKR